jgi:hypothetical protein
VTRLGLLGPAQLHGPGWAQPEKKKFFKKIISKKFFKKIILFSSNIWGYDFICKTYSGY